jgi:hypothetical protein
MSSECEESAIAVCEVVKLDRYSLRLKRVVL